MVALARHAETVGFEAIWVGDHVVEPRQRVSTYPYSTRGQPRSPLQGEVLNDVWVMIGAMIAGTTTLKVATGVLVLPMRNPIVTALAAATAHNLSGGRLLLGVGAGWFAEEFETLGEQFKDRGERMNDAIDLMRQLWGFDRATYSGNYYRVTEVRAARPHGHIPIIIGGSTAAALKRAARVGDGWYSPPGMTLEGVVAAQQHIDTMRVALDRASSPFDYYIRMTGPSTQESALAYSAAGFSHLVVGRHSLFSDVSTAQARVERLERFVEDVLAPCSAKY